MQRSMLVNFVLSILTEPFWGKTFVLNSRGGLAANSREDVMLMHSETKHAAKVSG